VVAERAGTNADATYRLLRGLATVGIVEALTDERFALTPVGECLRSDVPGSMRSLLIAEMAPGHWLPWGDMEHSIRTGTPAAPKTLGKPAWEYYAEHPEEANHFAQGMSGMSAMAIDAVLKAYSFTGAQLVVDVGGSHGSLLSAVLEKVPEARGILFDLPNVVSGAGPTLERAGVAHRVTCQGGSFFESVAEGGDVYLVKSVLHDWNDDECVRILSACRKAMIPGGRVVVIEMLISNQGPPSPAPLIDLNMLVMLTGRERTEQEYSTLFTRAGLALSAVVPTHSPFAAIEARAV
jgi:O-methyltransferase domain